MIPSWSDKHSNKRAQKIYLVSYWSCAAIGFIVSCAVFVIFLLLLKALSVDLNGVGISPSILMPLLLFYNITLATAKVRGLRALRIAGQIREETEKIPRTATNFAGPTLEVNECTVAFRLFGAGFFLLLVAGCCWLSLQYFRNSFYLLAIIGCAMLFAAGALQALFLVFNPELRLNERGITSCQGIMSSRLMRWEEIACLERKRVWGLPPNYEPTARTSETVTLQDATGKVILTLIAGAEVDDLSAAMGTVWTDDAKSLASKSNAPTQTQLFIAEIERRLIAATPPQGEENLDE